MASEVVKGTRVNLVFIKYFISLIVLRTFYDGSILDRSLHIQTDIRNKKVV